MLERVDHLFQSNAVAPRAVGHRRLIASGHDVVAYRVGIGLEQGALPRARRAAAGGEFRALEEARRAPVGAVIEVGVHPLEVEKLAERLAHADVGEWRPAGVEYERQHRAWLPADEPLADEPAAFRRGEIVLRPPAPGVALEAHVVEPALERLEVGIGVAVEVEAQLVEIVMPAVRRE